MSWLNASAYAPTATGKCIGTLDPERSAVALGASGRRFESCRSDRRISSVVERSF